MRIVRTDAARNNRARGALVGLAIGDTLGTPATGLTLEQISAQYGRITGYIAGQPGAVGSESAALTGTAIARHGIDLTVDDIEEVWRQATNDMHESQAGEVEGELELHSTATDDFSVVSSDEATEASLEVVREDSPARDPLTTVTFDDLLQSVPGGGVKGYAASEPRDGQGASNRDAAELYNFSTWNDAAALRITPIGMYAAGKPGLAADLAAIDAGISHTLDGVWCAQGIAAGVAAALVETEPEAVIAEVLSVLPRDSWTNKLVRRSLSIARNYTSAAEAAPDLYVNVAVAKHQWCNAGPESVALALGLFLASQGDFEDAVLTSANHGRNSYAIAAMAGALNGGLVGMANLPAAWAEPVRVIGGYAVGRLAGVDLLELSDQIAERSLGDAHSYRI